HAQQPAATSHRPGALARRAVRGRPDHRGSLLLPRDRVPVVYRHPAVGFQPDHGRDDVLDHRHRYSRAARRPAVPAARPACALSIESVVICPLSVVAYGNGQLTNDTCGASRMTVVKDLFRFSPSFRWGALFLLIVLVLVALSFISPYGPLDRRVVPNNRPPSARFLLGTTSLGQDVFWLTTFSVRNTLIIAGLAVLIGR